MALGGAPTAQDHLAKLGITAGRAREAVFDSFIGDTISLAGENAVFKAASATARVAIVNFALTLARTFVETDDFKRRYADHREANGPDPLPEEPSVDAILAKQRAGFEEQVEQMRKLFDQITPEQRATLEAGWKDMRQQLADMETGPRRAELDAALKRATRGAGARPRGGHETARRGVAGRRARDWSPTGSAISSRSRATLITTPSWSIRTARRCLPTPPSKPGRRSGNCVFGPENPPPTPPAPLRRNGSATSLRRESLPGIVAQIG